MCTYMYICLAPFPSPYMFPGTLTKYAASFLLWPPDATLPPFPLTL